MIDEQVVNRAVQAALDEDLGSGDITSQAVIGAGMRAAARIVARERMVVAGLAVARAVFARVDPEVEFNESGRDGEEAMEGESLAGLRGSARAILAGERTALNFLQRMSGIATAARRYVDAARGAGIEIADTRKTVPGLRAFDKYAVRIGGGVNHRAGLYDAILIKDNHWRLAGGVAEAVRRARRAFEGVTGDRMIEIEVGTVDEVREALDAGAGALLLDNMDPKTLALAVEVARGRAFLEISGGVRERDIAALSSLGVNRISVGALTHSVRAVDIALELEPL
ncbi:MAG TPA: carboxylating nicotinate-nucleotide diphosphorylase [Candidatus Polarisedimenticolia bacterium]|nr:carboxylating nicotinate-nucleotide diphosphorylase [Candidatus Polarisedimenticolia bacterium]